MMKTVIGIFSQDQSAEKAINDLKDKGFNPKDISIVMQDKRRAEDMAHNTGSNVAGGAVAGAGTGVVIGGLAGLLAGTVLPGLGGLLIGGPIGAALGLTGAAATTVSGAATGAVAGGLIGALMGLGVPKEDAKQYEERIKQGGILVAVPATSENYNTVQECFDQYGASDVKSVTFTPTEVGQEDVAERQHTPRSDAYDQRHAAYMAQGAKGGMSAHGQIANPIQVEKYLRDVNYPATKDDLLETAQNEGADEQIISTLQQLPDREYESPKKVSIAIGELD